MCKKKIFIFIIILLKFVSASDSDYWKFEELAVGDNLIKYTAHINQKNPNRGTFLYCYSNDKKIKFGVYNENQFINVNLEGNLKFLVDDKREYIKKSFFNRNISISKENMTEKLFNDLRRGHYLKVILEPDYLSKSEIYFSLKGSNNSLSKILLNCEK